MKDTDTTRASEAEQPRRRRLRVRRSQRSRRNFVLDSGTLGDLSIIQSAVRATSASEALRHAIRQYARLVRYVSNKEAETVIHVVRADGQTPPLILDIPSCRPAEVEHA